MTEGILQKLEEKIMSLLTEVESMRREIIELRQENLSLKGMHTDYMKKVQSLIGLLDGLESVPSAAFTREPERDAYAIA